MNIQPGSKIADVPLTDVRAFFKTYRDATWGESVVARELNLSTARAAELIRALLVEGYIEPAGKNRVAGSFMPYVRDGEIAWVTTVKGNALSLARATPRIKRATAERNLSAFLTRVEEVRDDERWVYKVGCVIVFGSYLEPEIETLGDVDLALRLVPKYRDPHEMDEQTAAYMRNAYSSGRMFRSVFEEIAAPQLDVLKYLRGRSRVLRIHPWEDPLVRTSPHEVIYRDPS